MNAPWPRATCRITNRCAALVMLAVALALPSSPLAAQRIAPSGVQHREAAPIDFYADSTRQRNRSHVDGAVRGGAIGLGVGAVTGMAFFGLIYTALSESQGPPPVDELVVPILTFGAMGGLAGATVGAIIGGIIGR
jgi:hypothetical protein